MSGLPWSSTAGEDFSFSSTSVRDPGSRPHPTPPRSPGSHGWIEHLVEAVDVEVKECDLVHHESDERLPAPVQLDGPVPHPEDTSVFPWGSRERTLVRPPTAPSVPLPWFHRGLVRPGRRRRARGVTSVSIEGTLGPSGTTRPFSSTHHPGGPASQVNTRRVRDLVCRTYN